jgi:hypothetical protein
MGNRVLVVLIVLVVVQEVVVQIEVQLEKCMGLQVKKIQICVDVILN